MVMVCGAAWAQTDEAPPPPPMVPADVQVQPQQPAQQQFNQLPDYQPGQSGQTYSNTPIDQANADQQPQQPQSDDLRDDQPTPDAAAESWYTSTRSKHFLAIIDGAIGVTGPGGTIFDARIEFDAARVSGLIGLTSFCFNVLKDPKDGATCESQTGHYSFMLGWGLLSSDLITLRALAGVDLLVHNQFTALNPIVGLTLRSMFGGNHFGVDLAAFLTPGPFRQFEARGGAVFAYGVGELHLGWRTQLIDAEVGGTFGDLFSIAPIVNGPYLGIALAL